PGQAIASVSSDRESRSNWSFVDLLAFAALGTQRTHTGHIRLLCSCRDTEHSGSNRKFLLAALALAIRLLVLSPEQKRAECDTSATSHQERSTDQRNSHQAPHLLTIIRQCGRRNCRERFCAGTHQLDDWQHP